MKLGTPDSRRTDSLSAPGTPGSRRPAASSAERLDSLSAPVLVSACLLGLPVRYDGRDKPRAGFLPADVIPVPVCPEVLGGLPTPRPASEIEAGSTGADVIEGKARVVSVEGKDVTGNFIRGAEAVLKLAEIAKAGEAYLKAESPSCDAGFGVAAALLKEHGVTVHSVE